MAWATREKDWSQTLLGPISGWPASILNAVNICLDSQFQLVVLCGPEPVYVYVDAAIPIFGHKYSWALGQRAADVWSEVWPTIGPMLQSVRQEERFALARAVHDQLGQILSAAKIDIKLLEDDFRSHDRSLLRRRIAAELRSARQTIDKAIPLVRQIATELRASELEDQGLYAVIKWHCRDFERRTRIPCKVTFAPDVRELTGSIVITLFRIFQESMTNVLRHAKASHVVVNIV